MRPESSALKALAGTLESLYGLGGGKVPLLEGGEGDPLATLILTILSQATSDTNSGRAFRELRSRFPTWEAVLTAPVEEVAAAIRSGGLAEQKAARIRRLLAQIKETHGSLDLDFLKSWDPGEAYRYLVSFEGVGPKTAACVLLFALKRPAFPVDTHILRISRRLGLVDPKCNAERAQEELSTRVPPEAAYSLHVNLIEHGRRVCHPARPGCSNCPLTSECEHYLSASTT